MDDRPRLTVTPNGPYAVTRVSAVTVLLAESRTEFHEVQLAGVEEDRVELCRCGHASTPLLCDRTCDSVPFDAPPAGRAPATAAEGGVRPRLAFVRNGPLMVAGIDVVHEDGSVTDLTDKEASLCRCGSSADKPWCDFSHRRIAFRS